MKRLLVLETLLRCQPSYEKLLLPLFLGPRTGKTGGPVKGGLNNLLS